MDHELVARSARAAHGVLLPEVLEAAGVSVRQRQRRVRAGEWRRLPFGAIVVAAVPESFAMRATGALVVVDDAALSHASAGELVGLDVSDRDVHLTTSSAHAVRRPGIVVHRSPLAAVDVTRRGGLATTTVERTLIDLGSVVSARRLHRLAEDALVRRLTTFGRLEAACLRLCRRGRAGTSTVRAALRALDGMPPSESELEARFLRLLDDAGLGRPTAQVSFEWSPGERGRVDLVVEADSLIIELDGRRFHERSAAFERDRRRDQLALVAGYRTVRFTYHQVTETPSQVLDVVRSLTPNTNRARSVT